MTKREHRYINYRKLLHKFKMFVKSELVLYLDKEMDWIMLNGE